MTYYCYFLMEYGSLLIQTLEKAGKAEGKKESWPVSRVLWSALRHSGSHSSGPAVTCRLEQPTRGQREPRYCPPIWSCSGWGLPCRFCYQKRGGLLPGGLATVRAPCGTRTVSPSPDPTPLLASRARLCGLAAANSVGGHRQTVLCGTFHRLAASGR